MRFYKFPGAGGPAVWINPDAVVNVEEWGNGRCKVDTGTNSIGLAMTAEDFVAAICPPAAPDTFEEALAAWKLKAQGPGPMNTAEYFGELAQQQTENEWQELRRAEGLEDRPMTAEEPLAPYKCPECGVEEGWLHDSGCPLNLRRHTVKKPMTTEPPPFDFITMGRDIVDKRIADACIDEMERTVSAIYGQAKAYWPRWLKEFVATRTRQITGIGEEV